MPVRSARLAAGQQTTLGAYVAVYTTPQGRTALVKDLRADNPGGTQTFIVWAMRSGPSQTKLRTQSLPAGDDNFVQGFWVLEPGDQLLLHTSAEAVNYWVSGAELDGVAP